MSNNSAQQKSTLTKLNEKLNNKNEKNKYSTALAIGSAIQDFQSIGTAKTGGERLQKIGGLIAKAIGASGG